MGDTVTINSTCHNGEIYHIHFHWLIYCGYFYTKLMKNTHWITFTQDEEKIRNDLWPHRDCGDLMESVNHWFIDNPDQVRSISDQPANDKDKQQQILKQIQESNNNSSRNPLTRQRSREVEFTVYQVLLRSWTVLCQCTLSSAITFICILLHYLENVYYTNIHEKLEPQHRLYMGIQ